MKQMCRACLHTKESFNYMLFENVSEEVYTFCTSVTISEHENLPRALCNSCYEMLIKYSNFKKKCMESQNILLGYKNNLKYEIEFDDAGVSQDFQDEEAVKVEDDIKIEDEKEQLCTNIVDTLQDSPVATAPFVDETLSWKNKNRKLKMNKVKRLNNAVKPKIKEKKNTFTYDCEICHKKFGYLARFEAHKLVHEGKKTSIVCKTCNKTFSNWQGHKRHIRNVHSVVSLSTLKCSKCGKLCKTRDSLKMHEKRHDLRNNQMCDVCGKEFKTVEILKSHLEIHKENRKKECTCEQCGRKFYSKTLLYSHKMRVHTDRYFICGICNYHFNEKHNLIKHIAAHEGKKLYKCEICQKAYSCLSSVAVHKRVHSGERPYQCTVCPKAFMSKKVLTDHIRIHTGERPYKCNVCDQSFNQQGTLLRHSRMHNRPVPVVK